MTPVLVLANDAQKIDRDRLTIEAWGSPLPLDAWLERERRLREHAWSRSGMSTWLWMREGATVASCETFRMSAALDGGAERAVYGVASVFVERRLRRRGYAREMMRALLDRLRELDPAALGSILFSDVGAPLYRAAGYVESAPPRDWLFPADANAPSEGVDWIAERDLPNALASFSRPTRGLVVWPGAEQLDWHLERERFYAQVLKRPRAPWIGAARGSSRAIWAADFRGGQLAILLLEASSPDDARALVGAARRVASRAGLSAVKTWERPGFDGGVVRPREDSLPMLAPLAPEVDPASWTRIPRALWI